MKKSDYYNEIKEIETVIFSIMVDSGKLKKKIRQNTIYLNDDELNRRCDINMKDVDTKFSKEEDLIELHLHMNHDF